MSAITNTSSHQQPKLHVIHATLPPRYLDPTQPPTKTVPFRQLNELPFVRNLRICMPTRIYDALYPNDNRKLTSATDDGGGRSRHIDSNGNTDNDKDSATGKAGPLYLQYVKLETSLANILANEEVRRGTLSIVSTCSSRETTICLKDGILTVVLPQHIYQRTGFPSTHTTKIHNGARKHDNRSALYRTVINMREPGMVKGRKAFDRLMYAAREVEGLKEVREWFGWSRSEIDKRYVNRGTKWKRAGKSGGEKEVSFAEEVQHHDGAGEAQVNTNRAPATNDETEVTNEGIQAQPPHKTKTPFHDFEPTISSTYGTTTAFREVLIPQFITDHRILSTLRSQTSNQKTHKASLPNILEDDIHDVSEYLSLLLLQSPRITKVGYNAIDPYLCSYVLPELSEVLFSGEAQNRGGVGHLEQVQQATVEDLCILEYKGFMTSEFVTGVVMDIMRTARARKMERLRDVRTGGWWVALNVVAYPLEGCSGPDGLMILLQGGEEISDVSQSDQPAGEDEMVVDMLDGRNEDEKMATSDGFRYVTCFEFVDNVTG